MDTISSHCNLCSSMQRNLLVHGRSLKHVDALCNLSIQTTMILNQLGIDTIMSQAPLLLPLLVVLPGILGETPVTAHACQQSSSVALAHKGAALHQNRQVICGWKQDTYRQSRTIHQQTSTNKHQAFTSSRKSCGLMYLPTTLHALHQVTNVGLAGHKCKPCRTSTWQDGAHFWKSCAAA